MRVWREPREVWGPSVGAGFGDLDGLRGIVRHVGSGSETAFAGALELFRLLSGLAADPGGPGGSGQPATTSGTPASDR